MDAASMTAVADALDSKDTKRRLQGLDALGEALHKHHQQPQVPLDRDSWQRVVAPAVRALRDNNHKVCRACLACLESLIGLIGTGIIPFLSMVTPAVVECLGNAKPSVQEQGVDLLLAISSAGVSGARDTLSALEPHFRHKNWRVREHLLAYLGRATEVDPAGVLRGRPPSALATMLAHAMNDSASQVRREAMTAAVRLMELTGDPLLVELEAKGVRSAQLSVLRESGAGSGAGSSGTSAPTGERTTAAGGRGVLSPTVATPAPSSRPVASAALRVGGSHGGGSGGDVESGRLPSSGGGRPSGAVPAGARRKSSRLVVGGGAGGANSVLVRPGGGNSEGATTPASAARSCGGVGAGLMISPVGGWSPGGGGGGGGEESAFSALDPLVPVKVYTERDVRREVDAAKAGLEHGSDWQRWVASMKRLAGVALGGAATEFPGLLVGLVRASVQEMVGHKVSENRSAVAREACRCVAVLARCLTDHFGSLAELWLPELLRNTTRAVVVAAAGDEAARAVFTCTTDGFPRLLPYLIDTARNKSAAIRRRCLDYVMLALARWSDAAFERYLPQIRDMVAAAVGDADSSVRVTARRGYWVLRMRFPALAQSVMDSLSPSMQRHVLREDQEFDAEAFVQEAHNAAEEPQPALGEHPRERATTATTDTITMSSAAGKTPSGSASALSLSANRVAHGVHHASSSAAAAAAVAVPGGSGHESSQPRRNVGQGFGGGGGVSYSSPFSVGGDLRIAGNDGGSGSGVVMKSTRVKVGRGGGGAGSVGGGSSGAGGGSRGGGEPARRTRGRLAVAQEATALTDTTSYNGFDSGGGGGGGGAEGGSAGLAPLRVVGGGSGGGGDHLPVAKPGAFRVLRGNAASSGGGGGGSAGIGEATRSTVGGGNGSGGGADSDKRPNVVVVERAQRVAKRTSMAVSSGMGVGMGEGAAAGMGGGAAAGLGGAIDGHDRGMVSGTFAVAGPPKVVLWAQQASRVATRHPKGGSGKVEMVVESEQQQQQQQPDLGVTERRAGATVARVGETMKAAVEPVALDRREILRQLDFLADDTGAPHWAARVEALERMLQLLTTAEKDGSGSEGGGEGGVRAGEAGRFVLESRQASQRLEGVIAERVKDAHFKVTAAALGLLGGLVRALPSLMARHLSPLLPLVFPTLADAKEPVRRAASRTLDACRLVYPPHTLCAVLCPRLLELAPGRARTGLLEFLAVLVPHSANFLGNPGHLQSLTQRVAVALIQSPPPPTSTTSSAGNRDGGGGGAGAGAAAATRLISALFRLDRDALGAATARLPPESAAAVRRALLSDLRGADATALLTPSSLCSPQAVSQQPVSQQIVSPQSLSQPKKQVSLQKTLSSTSLPASTAPPPPPSQQHAGGRAEGRSGSRSKIEVESDEAGVVVPEAEEEVRATAAEAATKAEVANGGEEAVVVGMMVTPVPGRIGGGVGAVESESWRAANGSVRTPPTLSPTSSSPSLYRSPAAVVFDAATPAAGGSSAGNAFYYGDGDGVCDSATAVASGRVEVEAVRSLSPAQIQHLQQQQQMQKQERQPLASVSLGESSMNNNNCDMPSGSGNGVSTKVSKNKNIGLICSATDSAPPPPLSEEGKNQNTATPTTAMMTGTTTKTAAFDKSSPSSARTTPPNVRSATVRANAAATITETGMAEAARRLIAGLTQGARSHHKVEALSSLEGLADGVGAGGHPEFWPRYFGQVLMLLLEGATAGAGGSGGGRGRVGGGGRGKRARSDAHRRFHRRALLRVKHLQGVRCLVARRGGFFPGSTEVVVGRLVEVGGADPCYRVRVEAEACLADLVPVLDSARYMAVLAPLLVPDFEAERAEAAAAAEVVEEEGDAWGFTIREDGSSSGGSSSDNVSRGSSGSGGGSDGGNWWERRGGDGGDGDTRQRGAATPRGVLEQCAVLGALTALIPRLSSPGLLGSLKAGPLLAGLAAAFGRRDLGARQRAVQVVVEMYQVLEEALLPFLSSFPKPRLKLITMYIERRQARDLRDRSEDRNEERIGGPTGSPIGNAIGTPSGNRNGNGIGNPIGTPIGKSIGNRNEEQNGYRNGTVSVTKHVSEERRGLVAAGAGALADWGSNRAFPASGRVGVRSSPVLFTPIR